MGELVQVGTSSLYQGPGIAAVRLQVDGAFTVGYFADGVLRGLAIPQISLTTTISDDGDGDNHILINPDDLQFWVINMLSIRSSITGNFAFTVNSDPVWDMKLTANIDRDIPIPSQGLTNALDDLTFGVKNLSASPATIIINMAYQLTWLP